MNITHIRITDFPSQHKHYRISATHAESQQNTSRTQNHNITYTARIRQHTHITDHSHQRTQDHNITGYRRGIAQRRAALNSTSAAKHVTARESRKLNNTAD
jgi:hypothetical protein